MLNNNKKIEELISIVKILRSSNGCPWDQEQTKESLIPYLIEEVYEMIECIDRNEGDLIEEIGDVLLHLVFQSSLAEDNKEFNFNDVINGINKKLVNRHPHVFNKEIKLSPQSIERNWESKKQIDKSRKSRLDGIPVSLPSIVKSERLQQKASSAGFDWDNIKDVWNKVYEEIDEVIDACNKKDNKKIEEEIGDCLFSIINLSRHLNISAENALRKSNNKFISRFQKMELKIIEGGKSIDKYTLLEMDKIWNQVK